MAPAHARRLDVLFVDVDPAHGACQSTPQSGLRDALVCSFSMPLLFGDCAVLTYSPKTSPVEISADGTVRRSSSTARGPQYYWVERERGRHQSGQTPDLVLLQVIGSDGNAVESGHLHLQRRLPLQRCRKEKALRRCCWARLGQAGSQDAVSVCACVWKFLRAMVGEPAECAVWTSPIIINKFSISKISKG